VQGIREQESTPAGDERVTRRVYRSPDAIDTKVSIARARDRLIVSTRITDRRSLLTPLI